VPLLPRCAHDWISLPRMERSATLKPSTSRSSPWHRATPSLCATSSPTLLGKQGEHSALRALVSPFHPTTICIGATYDTSILLGVWGGKRKRMSRRST
jgi:hypothetical protein